MVNARHYTASETLKDGRPVLIRAIRPDDKDALTTGFARLSEDTVYRRFLHHKRDITHQELDDYTDLDFVNHVGLVAVVDEGSQEHIIGGGRYIGFCDKAGKSHAELAFTVVDAYQGLGLATHFLQHLTQIGRANGIEVFDAEVLANNRPMLRIFEKSGLPMKARQREDIVHVTLSLARPEDHL